MGTVIDAAEVLAALYPPPHEVVRDRRVRSDGFWALPSADRARLLLPSSGDAAAAALRHARRPLTRRSRLVTAAACRALRTGAGHALGGFRVRRSPGADSIEDLLTAVLDRPVRVGVFLGPPRANRKPVLQVLDEHGRLIAVAKVGLTDLARHLAATEATALKALGRRRGMLTTPDLVHFGEWRDHTVLVQTALDLVDAPVRVDDDVRRAAMRELATLNGVRTEPWVASSYLLRLSARVRALPASPLTLRMRLAVDELAGVRSGVRLGTWHGDWTAWNMAVRDGRALVWDWERYETDVPLGFDALHYAFMPALKAATGVEAAGVRLLARAPALLEGFGVAPDEAHRVAASYLLDLATRYLTDRQAETGVGGGAVASWLEPALAAVRPR